MVSRPTLEDVAARAGVSRATAARILAGSPDAAAATREQVLRAAEQLQYTAHAAARALASGTGTRIVIGVVSRRSTITVDEYLGRFVASAAATAGATSVGITVQPIAADAREGLDALARDPTVQGVVLVNPVRSVVGNVPARLAGRIVAVGVGSGQVPAVDVDTESATRSMTEHLVQTGRRTIAMIAGPRWLPCARRALRGYAEAMDRAGLDVCATDAEFDLPAGRRAAARLLRRRPDIDAIVTACDEVAVGALETLRCHGRRVPDDVAVAGFGDTLLAAAVGLSTATHPAEQIAATATRCLLDPSAAIPLDAPRWFGSERRLRLSA